RVFRLHCKTVSDDQGDLSQLDRVCEDCYNLYRKPHVATECRY
ncbi:UNVERIFIED_CONTAM: hypothetical protein GTU68_050741, partial [Idotea baltica]|nr:hypothetical protein [Idotea baltica]